VISIRNALLVLGLTTAVAVGTVAAPAGASLADSAAVSTTIATNSVAPVTNLVGKLACTDPTSTMSATWTRSTSARVTGYVLKVHWSDGALDEVPLGPTASSWSQPINKYFVTAWAVQYSVTTITDYGWTKETVKTAAFQC
jgi:hypothetical protein